MREVNALKAIDFDPVFIEDASKQIKRSDNVEYQVHDIHDDLEAGSVVRL